MYVASYLIISVPNNPTLFTLSFPLPLVYVEILLAEFAAFHICFDMQQESLSARFPKCTAFQHYFPKSLINGLFVVADICVFLRVHAHVRDARVYLRVCA